jgi:hypothetical protein
VLPTRLTTENAHVLAAAQKKAAGAQAGIRAGACTEREPSIRANASCWSRASGKFRSEGRKGRAIARILLPLNAGRRSRPLGHEATGGAR